MENEINNILIDSIWVVRWNKEKTAMKAILKPKEAEKMAKRIIKNLKKSGYKIQKVES